MLVSMTDACYLNDRQMKARYPFQVIIVVLHVERVLIEIMVEMKSFWEVVGFVYDLSADHGP